MHLQFTELKIQYIVFYCASLTKIFSFLKGVLGSNPLQVALDICLSAKKDTVYIAHHTERKANK